MQAPDDWMAQPENGHALGFEFKKNVDQSAICGVDAE